MAGIISFFVVLIVSIIVVRVSSIMLVLTGLSPESAKFQARSSFTGTGFTTKESENVVNHPVRRKIVMTLMLIRNAGFISLFSSITLSFINTSSNEEVLRRMAWLAGGLILIVILSRSKLLDKILGAIVEWALKKWTKLKVADYESLLNFSGEYEIIEIGVHENSWIANKSLIDLKLSDEGILMLAIKRLDGYFLGTPTGTTIVNPGDSAILYGREEALRDVSERKADEEGEKHHLQAVEKQNMWRTSPGKLKKSKKKIGELFHKKE